MRKGILAVFIAAVLPLAAIAQGPGGPRGPGNGEGYRQPMTPETMVKRMRLARTLGLAAALDLDAQQALKLGETIGKMDDRRLAAFKQMRDAHGVLRRAAQGEKVPAAEVDQAIQRALDARAQLQAVDRETVAAVTKDLTPEKKARAVLFLARFQHRLGPMMMHRRGGMMNCTGGGPCGPGMMRGMGEPGGFGMGPGGGDGQIGMGPPPDDWDEPGE